MLKPRITVLLTTYKRPDDLKRAIQSVLNQDEKKFELLIVDDASRDWTKEMVKHFNDKRIRYHENTKNLGFPGTFRWGVKESRGKYIFLLSDDDMILSKNTLRQVWREMEKYNAGYGQTGLLFYDEDMRRPCAWAAPRIIGMKYVKSDARIFRKTMRWHFGFASGNIYRKDFLNINDIINDVWFSHVKPAFRILSRHSALYFGNLFILGKISKSGNASYMNVSTNKGFHYEKLFSLYDEFESSDKNRRLYKKIHLEEGVIGNLIGIKYYTSNKNIYTIIQRLLAIEPSYMFSPKLWFNICMALMIPKALLKYIRMVKISLEERAIASQLP